MRQQLCDRALMTTAPLPPAPWSCRIQVRMMSLNNRLLNFSHPRLLHRSSGRTYHTEFNPPKQEMTDDVSYLFASIIGVLLRH